MGVLRPFLGIVLCDSSAKSYVYVLSMYGTFWPNSGVEMGKHSCRLKVQSTRHKATKAGASKTQNINIPHTTEYIRFFVIRFARSSKAFTYFHIINKTKLKSINRFAEFAVNFPNTVSI